MTARIRSAALVFALLLVLSACGAPSAATTTSTAASVAASSAAAASASAAPEPTTAPTTAPTAAPVQTVAGDTNAAGEVAVEIGDNTFAPKTLSVPVGTKVVWTNTGQRPHTVTADDSTFKSDTLNNGGTFSQTFAQPGTFAYFCEFHGGPGGISMSGTVTVTGGDAAAAPTPTFEAVTDAEPTVAAIAATGNAGYRDQVLRGDGLTVSITDLAPPAAGEAYTAWLAGKDSRLALGTLGFGSGTATATYVAPGHDNLIGTFDRVFVTKGAAGATAADPEVIMVGGLPPQALVHIRHVLFSIGATPGKIGFALGLRQETDELLRHAQFLQEAFEAGNLALEKVHAEHIINLIGGAQGADFGDLNGDGKVQNPGDGFGLLPNGQQDGYMKGMNDHAKLGADSPDATDAIKLHAGHVQIAGENVRVRVQDINDRAHRILAAGGIAATQEDVLTMLALSQQTIQGVDANNDEQVTPTPGEGGVLTAYQHAQLMAGIPITPDTGAFGKLPPEAQPSAVPASAATVEIADNTFTPKTITVPLGATIVWNDGGQKPHTVTADDGAFDSGRLANGQTYTQTFAAAGTFAYFCSIHGGKGGTGMSGAIVVVDAANPAAAPAPAAPPAGAASAAAPAPTATPAPAPTVAAPPPAAAPGKVEVAVGDNTFTAKELSVPVGTTVIWTNTGQRPHTVTADDDAFKSDTLNNGGTFSRSFDQPGTFAYYCEFHGGPGAIGMSGVIRVGN